MKTTQITETKIETACSFAFPGTYGHECGKPAVRVGVRKSHLTKNGIYYARRCAECASRKGGENTGVTRWENFDATRHANQW